MTDSHRFPDGGWMLRRTFSLQGILHFRFGDVDDSVHVERDLLSVGCPALVAEAVDVFAVRVGSETVVVGGNGLLEVLTVS